MELSVREAATLMGCSPRTVRARLLRGDLPGVKRGSRWRLERRDLPLTDSQRRGLQARADRVREAVEEALPPRLARTAGQRRRSLADLKAFRLGARLLADLRVADAESLPKGTAARAAESLEEALLALAEGAQQFDRAVKLEAFNRSRGHLARVVALLLLAGEPPPEPVVGWVARLEEEVIPAVAGLARWADEPRRRRRSR